jgi:hypothetical protein
MMVRVIAGFKATVAMLCFWACWCAVCWRGPDLSGLNGILPRWPCLAVNLRAAGFDDLEIPPPAVPDGISSRPGLMGPGPCEPGCSLMKGRVVWDAKSRSMR